MAVKNVGGSAADNVQTFVIEGIEPDIPPGDLPADLTRMMQPQNRSYNYVGYIEPGQQKTNTAEIFRRRLTAMDLDGLTTGRLKLQVFGRITFETRGESHFVEFCWFWNGSLPAGVTAECNKWNFSR